MTNQISVHKEIKVDLKQDTFKIKDTNKAATKTKEQSQTLRIKNELKYLQMILTEIFPSVQKQIGRAVQQECRDRYRMPSSA